jgi:hypothetical protein
MKGQAQKGQARSKERDHAKTHKYRQVAWCSTAQRCTEPTSYEKTARRGGRTTEEAGVSAGHGNSGEPDRISVTQEFRCGSGTLEKTASRSPVFEVHPDRSPHGKVPLPSCHRNLLSQKPFAQGFAFCPDSRLLQATNAWNAAEGFVEGNNLSSAGFRGNLGNEVIGKSRRPFSGCLQSSQSDRR